MLYLLIILFYRAYCLLTQLICWNFVYAAVAAQHVSLGPAGRPGSRKLAPCQQAIDFEVKAVVANTLRPGSGGVSAHVAPCTIAHRRLASLVTAAHDKTSSGTHQTVIMSVSQANAILRGEKPTCPHCQSDKVVPRGISACRHFATYVCANDDRPQGAVCGQRRKDRLPLIYDDLIAPTNKLVPFVVAQHRAWPLSSTLVGEDTRGKLIILPAALAAARRAAAPHRLRK